MNYVRSSQNWGKSKQTSYIYGRVVRAKMWRYDLRGRRHRLRYENQGRNDVVPLLTLWMPPGPRATNLRFTQIKSQTQTHEFYLTWDISDLVCHQPKSYSTYVRFYLSWDLRFFSVAKSVIFTDFHAINSTKARKCVQIRHQYIPLTFFFQIIHEKHDTSAFIYIIHSVSDLPKSQLRSQT